MKQIPILNDDELIAALDKQKNPYFSEYYACYSSWFGGITTNPHRMLLPLDDHMVHRGDGVFEAMKAVNRGVFMMNEHMQRLLQSAAAIQLNLPISLAEMNHIILETVRAAQCDDAIIRVFLSRGPGNFSVNPYDSVGAQFYVVIAELKKFSDNQYEQGVSVGQSTVPVKNAWMARVKSCNYLPNVMMKKEAVDRKFDFMINFDDSGFVAEGATENIMIVDADGNIVHPEFDSILKGTTMMRVCELAQTIGIRSVVKAISLADLINAREVMMCGTTLDVLPVTRFEEHIISDGKVGGVARKLRVLLQEDIKHGIKRTQF